ncbi:MAG: carbohydrate kinase family protein [Candidatus Acidiferrales bacterium]
MMVIPASARSDRGMVVFGEFFFDLVFYNLPTVPRMGEEVKTASFARFPGGGLATTALVAAGLGTPVSAITRIGRDALASPEWQRLIQSGISTQGCECDPHLATAITVCAACEGDRMMITHDRINVRLGRLLARSGVQKQLRRAHHLHMACALWPPRPWMTAIRKLRKRGLTVSADLGWNLEVFESSRLPSLLKEFEFTFPNELEATAMTGEKTVEAAARKLARWVRVPVVKLGRDGSLAVRDGKIVRMKSIRVRAVDATGSGDAFNGGFLHGYLAGWSLEECMRAGNICGALATTGAGGSCAIPTRERLKKLMKKFR